MKKIIKNIFLLMTLTSYLASLLVFVFGLNYESTFGLLIFLVMVSTSIIRFGVVHNILFDLLGLDLDGLNLILELLISVLLAIGADRLLRRVLNKYKIMQD